MTSAAVSSLRLHSPGNTELVRLITDLTGKQDSLRTQLTEVYKRITKISVGPETLNSIQQFHKEFEFVSARLKAFKAEQDAFIESCQGIGNILREVMAMRQEQSSLRNDVNQTRAEVAALREMKQRPSDLSAVASDLASLKAQSLSNAQQINSLSAVLGDVRPLKDQIMSNAQQVQVMAGELQALKQEWSAATGASLADIRRQSTSNAQQLQVMAGELQAAKQEWSAATGASLADIRRQSFSNAQQLQVMAWELQASKQEWSAATGASLADIRRQSFSNAQQLQVMARELQALKQEWSAATGASLADIRRQSTSNAQQLQVMARELQEAKQEVSASRDALSSVAEIKRANGAAMQRMDKCFQELQSWLLTTRETKDRQAELARGLDWYSSESRDLGRRLGNEIINARRQLEESLRQDVGRDLSNVKANAHVTLGEFRGLRQELLDSGVLKPKQPEANHKAVGTVELGENCFSARLLIRLSYIMARTQAKAEDPQAETRARGLMLVSGEAEGSDEESESMTQLEMDMENDVHGLQSPTIGINERGYMLATYGFGSIIWVTIFLQMLIVVILVWYSQVPTQCWDATPDLLDWFVLHISKAAAVFVAGGLMCKDLMEIGNQLMVSVLLQGGFDCESVASVLLRSLVIALIGMANVFLFRGMVSAVDVWVNMAALAFIAELGGGVLDAAKSGVFGHTIRAVTTELRYELTFYSEYPWWIPVVQQGTILVMTMGTTACAGIAFIDEEPMCPGSA